MAETGKALVFLRHYAHDGCVVQDSVMYVLRTDVMNSNNRERTESSIESLVQRRVPTKKARDQTSGLFALLLPSRAGITS